MVQIVNQSCEPQNHYWLFVHLEVVSIMGPTYNCNICWFFVSLCLDHLVNLHYLCYVVVWLFMYITLLRMNQIDKLEIIFVKICDGTVVAQNLILLILQKKEWKIQGLCS